MAQKFDITKRDSQSSIISPVRVADFDIERYAEYEAELLEGNKKFFQGKSGIQVYRRVRADGVFFDKSRDYKESLELQLGALQKSYEYKADIANFLEPWYGIGYIASSFGSEYIWQDGSAPAVHGKFSTMQEVLNHDCKPIAETPIGKHMLETIEYFLENTKGKIPMSFTDVQSPLNMMSYLFDMNDLFIEMIDDPDSFLLVIDKITKLLIDFLKIQEKLIGSALALPGHGFASSKMFSSVGMSADNVVMISRDQYEEMVKPSDEMIGKAFGGLAFHSCGDWSLQSKMVKEFETVKTIDGAFSPETDPQYNEAKKFNNTFENSQITVNARCVGKPQDVLSYFTDLYGENNNMKMIAVTYCETAKEQEELYDALHKLDR